MEQDSETVWSSLTTSLHKEYSERGRSQTPPVRPSPLRTAAALPPLPRPRFEFERLAADTCVCWGVLSAQMEGPAWCMHTHRWAATRGECRAIELESFDGKEVVIATTFHTHGVAAIPYKDSFVLASGSALTLSHTSACLWTEAQAGTLVESIAAACALNELPEVYSQIEGPIPIEPGSPRAAYDPERGARWVQTLCNERLRAELEGQAAPNGYPNAAVWGCRRFDWAGRTHAAPDCQLTEFRGFQVVSCDRTPVTMPTHKQPASLG